MAPASYTSESASCSISACSAACSDWSLAVEKDEAAEPGARNTATSSASSSSLERPSAKNMKAGQ